MSPDQQQSQNSPQRITQESAPVLAGEAISPPESCKSVDQRPPESSFSFELHGERIEDNYQWLEDVHGAQPTVFVEQQNRRTLERFSGPLYEELKETFTRLNTADDLDLPTFGKTLVMKHKAGPDSPKGKLLVAAKDDYLRDRENTRFDTLLDIDQLAKTEGVDWVYAGSSHKRGIGDRMIVYLSRGGTDATVVRELDIAKRELIDDGLRLEGEVRVTYLGKSNDVAFAVPGPGTTSASGYPLEVKLWNRKAGAIEDAATLFKAPADHMSVGVGEWEIAKNDRRIVVSDYINFYEGETHVFSKDRGTSTKLPLPRKADILAVKNGSLLFSPREKFELGGRDYQGGLVAFDLAGYLDSGIERYTRVLQMQGSQSLDGAFVSKGKLYVQYSENVVSKICESEFSMSDLAKGKVAAPSFREIPLPGHGSINAFCELKGVGILVGYTDFVTPQSYYLIQPGATGLGAPFLQEPAKFDASQVSVTQQWAVSADGTRVPYFVLDGRDDKSKPAPAILYGYGGFQISLTPEYSWVRGKGWLEKGGVYAIANIRGGGEFGPAWHEAALRENRKRAYEDFAAVAEGLCVGGFTSRERLGVMGGSNGGLLVGNMVTMYPDRFRAGVSNVPLLDMLRYDELLKGSSWVAEYGSPKIEEEYRWLKTYSPYHNVNAGTDYPAVLFATSTADDRVHPCHARKMAARMQGLGVPDIYLYEQTDGGHGNADFVNWIPETALIYSFFHELLK